MPLRNLKITGGRIIDPACGTDKIADLFIAQNHIAGIGQAPAAFADYETLDANGRIVMPGLVDLAVRLREPGFEHKATIYSETCAAAAGGITRLCCLPDTEPVCDSPAEVRLIQECTAQAGFAHVCVLGALTKGLAGETLSEMAALKAAGCVGISNALRPLASTLVMRRALEYAASQGLTVFLHPFDHALAARGCVHEGHMATRLGLPGIPEANETAAVGQLLALVLQTGARVHFCRLSTARAVRMIARARFDGLPITADVAAHQLFLTEDDIGDFNSLCHVLPPLRTAYDRDELRHGVACGEISAICSDHQPHDPDAKEVPFTTSEPGISALNTLLPLTLKLVDEGIMSLINALARVTVNPATILGIDAGTLRVGSPADLCIVDPHAQWTLHPQDMPSSGKNTPFMGSTFRGRVTHTLLGGRLVHPAGD